MEISLLSPQSIRIKGKQGAFVINPSGKVTNVSALISFDGIQIDKTKVEDGTVILKGPGEYEVAGIKISGIRNGAETVYSLNVDKVDVLLARGKAIEKDHTKLREHNIVVLFNDTITDSSFITALAPNVVIFYGPNAEDSIKQLAKESYRTETKYQITLDKLPQEMEEILLQ